MLIRRALALSALALATALAGDNIPTPATPVFRFNSPVIRPVSVGLSGQKKAPRSTPSPSPTPTPAANSSIASAFGPPDNSRIISLHEAVTMALKDNIDIQFLKTDLKLNDSQVRVAWGAFDPSLNFSANYTDSRTPENPTIITSADTAQQILLEQEDIAAIEANAAPTPAPLPTTNPAATPTPLATVNNSPYIFKNEDFVGELDISGTLPTGTTYKLGAQAEHLNDTVLGLNQDFLPSNVFFAGLTLDQPLLQGVGYDANLASVRIGRRNRAVSYNN